MNSNSISKFEESNEISFINTMGLIDTKTVDSTANVIKKIEPTNIDPHLTNILLLIIVIILCGYIPYKTYLIHNKCITKRTLSQANGLDKI